MSELWVDGLDASIRPPQEMAILSIQATRPIWRQDLWNRHEPLAAAYRRLIGREMPAPILISAVHHEGRWKTLHTHPGAVMVLYDPAIAGWEIRTMAPELKAALLRSVNCADRMAAKGTVFSPLTLAGDTLQADGRVGQAGIRWFQESHQ